MYHGTNKFFKLNQVQMPPSSAPRSSSLSSLIWALAAAGLFALTAALSKLAVADYHLLQVLFFRQLIVAFSTVPALMRGGLNVLRTRAPGWHALRLTGAFTALAGGIWAVDLLPLTTATTLFFAQVFFVTLLAVLLLSERVGRHRLWAVLVGFAGVVVAMRPGVDGLLDPRALVPLGAALGAALAVIAVRRLSQQESTATLLVYQSLFVGLLSGLPLWWFWTTPNWAGLLLLLGLGLVATAGQWVGVQALRMGEASLVGNVEYSKLAYAALFGYLLFDELPDGWTLAGAAIIIAAALYLLQRERRHNPR